jgi:hypothetical protein
MSASHITDSDWTRFSATVLYLIQDVNASKHSVELNEVYRHTLIILLRRFTDRFWYKRLLASKACLEHSRTEGIADIRKLDPHEVPVEFRASYRLEHYLPIADLRKSLMEIEKPDQQKVEELLRAAAIEKIWILKEEDNRLKRYNRRNPAEAYKAAGIDIVFE